MARPREFPRLCLILLTVLCFTGFAQETEKNNAE